MSLSVEKLLEQRFKVIADYPHSPYKIGDLVEIPDSSTSYHCTTTKAYNSFTEEMCDSANYFSILQIENYKHLFRKLEWWEERDISEMPEYVKEEGGKIYLASWVLKDKNYPIKMILYEAPNELQCAEYYVTKKVMCFFEIATESEYLQYQSKVIEP